MIEIVVSVSPMAVLVRTSMVSWMLRRSFHIWHGVVVKLERNRLTIIASFFAVCGCECGAAVVA